MTNCAHCETPVDKPKSTENQLEMLRNRNKKLMAGQPKFRSLRDKLLKNGGKEVVFFHHEHHLDNLIKYGEALPAKGARQLKGESSRCHENSARIWLTSPDTIKIGTGYALSSDGLWRQHSWAIEDRLASNNGLKNRIPIETTTRRIKYFGIVLNRAETLEFVAGTIPEISIWINEANSK